MGRTLAGIAFACLAAVSFVGCGEPKVGNAVTGTVTFKGAPVPAGMIYFDPDSANGGSGTQGSAKIVDGKFSTDDSGQGVPSGAVVVRIEGFEKHATDPESFGKPICKWQTTDTFSGGGEKTYDVPETAEVKGGAPSPEV